MVSNVLIVNYLQHYGGVKSDTRARFFRVKVLFVFVKSEFLTECSTSLIPLILILETDYFRNPFKLNFTQIKETCLYFHDLGKARRFYHEVLGLPVISYVPDKHIFFTAGTSVLLCFNRNYSKSKKSPPAHFAEGPIHLAFEVRSEEYEAHKQELLKKGIGLIDKVIWETGQESFYFEDPEGNVLEIVPVGIWAIALPTNSKN